MSWTKEEYIDRKDSELEVIDKVLHNNRLPRLDFLADAAHERLGELHHDHHESDDNDHPTIEEHVE